MGLTHSKGPSRAKRVKKYIQKPPGPKPAHKPAVSVRIQANLFRLLRPAAQPKLATCRIELKEHGSYAEATRLFACVQTFASPPKLHTGV